MWIIEQKILMELSVWIVPRKHIIRIEVQRPEARLKFVIHGKLGRPLPSATDQDYQKLLFHKQAVSNNGFYTTRTPKLVESGQQMHEQETMFFMVQ